MTNVDDEVPQSESSESRDYRPSVGIVTGLVILLLAYAALEAAFRLFDVARLLWFPEAIYHEQPQSAGELVVTLGGGVAAMLLLLVYAATIVMFLVWIFRANKNARALGAAGMRFSAGGCVGWWFVPVANVWMPYRAVKEIYHSSDPTAGEFEWRKTKAPSVVGWWWLTWISAGFLGLIETRFAVSPPEELMLSAGGGILSVLSALLATSVVREIHERQQQKAAGMGSMSSPHAMRAPPRE